MWPFKKKVDPYDLGAYWDSLDLDKEERKARKIPDPNARRLALLWIQNLREERREITEEGGSIVMNMDYQKLGALVGSAWKEQHPDATKEQADVAPWEILRVMGLSGVSPFFEAMDNTMHGRCFGCGTQHEVGHDADGILCCEVCVGR